LAGKWIPRWVAEGSFYRPRPTDRATRSYAVLGWINTVGCAAAFRIRAAWGMSLTTSADHAFIIEAGGESVKVKQEGERMQRAESEGGRARLVETLSKVSPAVSGRGVK
ncbi:TPA: hypothetical protein ACKP5U_006645, partial [Pseudomonas aeruginosa]